MMLAALGEGRIRYEKRLGQRGKYEWKCTMWTKDSFTLAEDGTKNLRFEVDLAASYLHFVHRSAGFVRSYAGMALIEMQA